MDIDDLDGQFDRSLRNALHRMRCAHPLDAQRLISERKRFLPPPDPIPDPTPEEQNAQPVQRVRPPRLWLATHKGLQYWRAYRRRGNVLQSITRRCRDDQDPGSVKDIAYHEVLAWCREYWDGAVIGELIR